jgi:hypothetical protein
MSIAWQAKRRLRSLPVDRGISLRQQLSRIKIQAILDSRPLLAICSLRKWLISFNNEDLETKSKVRRPLA